MINFNAPDITKRRKIIKKCMFKGYERNKPILQIKLKELVTDRKKLCLLYLNNENILFFNSTLYFLFLFLN